jgi:hypothetical protein
MFAVDIAERSMPSCRNRSSEKHENVRKKRLKKNISDRSTN